MKKSILTFAIVVLALSVSAQSDLKSAFNRTLNAYFELKNGLAKDDVTKAASAAEKVIAATTALNTAAKQNVKQVEISKQTALILQNAKPIVASKELKVQRNSFSGLSSAMLALARSLQLNQSTVFVQYCPMAKKYWLNDVEAVQNPFYGSMMYDCGDVTETIKGK